jgi:BMFP domain-containing protein YqiC|tara:strand:- start:1256 stop:1495 length:240 start_codon:yes stop_codon:yes gene_type:complete
VPERDKILKILSKLIENGILTANDVKKEFINNVKFGKDSLINQLDLVSREEFEVLKKIVEKQEQIIKKFQKKTKKAKKS